MKNPCIGHKQGVIYTPETDGSVTVEIFCVDCERNTVTTHKVGERLFLDELSVAGWSLMITGLRPELRGKEWAALSEGSV